MTMIGISDVYGEAWTLKELLVLPNEFVYWPIQIVMYSFMTGLVAGAFVLSSLYHFFGVQALKGMSRFALVFSFALLPVANLPPLLFLQQPQRAHYIFLTPHFTSAIAAFGVILLLYGGILASELWFIYRSHFLHVIQSLRKKKKKAAGDRLRLRFFSLLTLGARDLSPEALARDSKAVKILAGVGIPVACFMHGYAGFIFGSVKANALWMTPLMPILFILSAVISGIALCALCYIVALEIRRFLQQRRFARMHPQTCSLEARAHLGVGEREVRVTAHWLIVFLLIALVLGLLDEVFRGYTAMKTWDVLRQVIYQREFANIFILQHGLGTVLPLVLLLLPKRSLRRTAIAAMLVLVGVFMMRWNVVIGGQSFSLTTAGFMHYEIPILPRNLITLKEGLLGAVVVFCTPFLLLGLLNRIFPVLPGESRVHAGEEGVS
jgi:predicted membrane protein